LTITGTGGTLTRTTSATLVINPPAAGDFTLSATPASQTVKQGVSTTYTVNITRSGGFTGAVQLSLSSTATGLGVLFLPNPATGASSALTVTPGQTTTPGTYTLTVTGTSGSLTRSTTVMLVVTQGCFGGDGDC
jgi:uncharacterized membrane protein